ncbi:MAG: hypothetical protein P1U85_13990 [Verrucomicrobiales bacterium]|jgi:hypothetical protein|nr:hypothetical protein [Verrucomicrobiales bacterium]
MAARRDRNYGKEIIGAMMWIALIAYLFWGDGILGCSEADSTNLRGAEETSP